MGVHESKKLEYVPPTLVLVGRVDELTQGFPGGSSPDALAVNHATVSGTIVTGSSHFHP
jgi:hypothetical protein